MKLIGNNLAGIFQNIIYKISFVFTAMEMRREAHRQLRFQTHISRIQILIFTAPLCRSTVAVSPSLLFPQNWSETLHKDLRSRPGPIILLCVRTRRTGRHVSTTSLATEVRWIQFCCSRQQVACSPVVHFLGFFVATRLSVIRDILISVFTDASTSVICDLLH